MRRIVALVVLVMLASCRTAPLGGPEPGAPSSEAAVAQFLAAARAQDLQAMSAMWGNSESLVREREDRQELERRLIVMACHLKHDESRIGPSRRGEGGRILHDVELSQGPKRATSTFTTVRNASADRWFVENFEIESLQELCAAAPSGFSGIGR